MRKLGGKRKKTSGNHKKRYNPENPIILPILVQTIKNEKL